MPSTRCTGLSGPATAGGRLVPSTRRPLRGPETARSPARSVRARRFADGVTTATADLTPDGLVVDNTQGSYFLTGIADASTAALSGMIVGYVLQVSPAPAITDVQRRAGHRSRLPVHRSARGLRRHRGLRRRELLPGLAADAPADGGVPREGAGAAVAMSAGKDDLMKTPIRVAIRSRPRARWRSAASRPSARRRTGAQVRDDERCDVHRLRLRLLADRLDDPVRASGDSGQLSPLHGIALRRVLRDAGYSRGVRSSRE